MDDQGRGKKDHALPSDLQEHVPANWFSNWEEQLLVEADNEQLCENQYNSCQRQSDQRLWISFQNTASSIAQLYKDRLQDPEGGWTPFQMAATSATNLYKDSVEIGKMSCDLALQCGYQRRNKELLAWVRKKKRHVRREDLISFLCGRSPPHRSSTTSRSSKPSSSYAGNVVRSEVTHDNDLQQFQEALSMHGLNGAMAGISVQSHPGSPNPRHHPGSPSSRQHRGSPGCNTHSGIHHDLTNFIAEEFRRRRNDSSLACTSSSRGRSQSPSGHARKRHQSSDSSAHIDNTTVPKKPRK